VSKSREALVGVVIVGAVLLGVFGTLWLQGFAWGAEHREVTAVFTEIGQVRTGAPVKFRGVRVGRVRDIRVDPGGQFVRLRLTVHEHITLPDDAVVILSPESMFGDWQAEIHTSARFPYAEYARIDEPDVLPGYALPDIAHLTAMADRISDNIAVLTERVGIAFSEETARNVADLIENVQEVSRGLSDLVTQQAESFAQVTEEVRGATRGVTSAARQAESTLLTAEQTIRNMDGLLQRRELETALQDLAETAENLRGFSGDLRETNVEVREMAARVDSTFIRIGGVLGRFENAEGTLGRLLHDPTAAAELEGSLAELQLLLEDIRENPRRYLRLSIF
jgi:phospholipid/cholesterol/gamma-HCH transport system substrate-binding protein